MNKYSIIVNIYLSEYLKINSKKECGESKYILNFEISIKILI